MKLYDALKLVCDLAEQSEPTDPNLAKEQDEALTCVREFAWGYFPGSRHKEAKKGK